MTRTALFIQPLDQLFFRDGRAFGASSRVNSGLPNPTTLTGALRTLMLTECGADFSKIGKATRDGASMEEAFHAGGAPPWITRMRVRGPWLARSGKQPTLYFRRPRTFRPLDNGFLAPLQPMNTPLPGWKSAEGLAPLWCSNASSEKESKAPDLLPSNLLDAFLKGKRLESKELAMQSNLFGWQDKTGIQVN